MKIPKLLYFKRKYYNPQDYYRRLLIRYSGPTFYTDLQYDIENKNKLAASEEISLFRNKPFRKISIADIKKQYGNPNYQIKDEWPVHKEIFFYRLFLGKLRVNLELHFSWDELFSIAIAFRT